MRVYAHLKARKIYDVWSVRVTLVLFGYGINFSIFVIKAKLET